MIKALPILIILTHIFCASNSSIKHDEPFNAAVHLYKSSLWTDRVSSMALLRDSKSESSYKLALIGLSDTHSRVRAEACRTIASFPGEKSVIILFHHFKIEIESNIKWIIISEISSVSANYKSSYELFLSGIHDKDWLVREISASAFCSIRDTIFLSNNVSELAALLKDNNENVRLSVLNNLSFTNSNIYSILANQIISGKYYTKPIYLKSLLNSISYYKLDSVVRSSISSLITHPNQDIRINALACINKSDKL